MAMKSFVVQAPGLKEAEKHKEEFILFFFLNVYITGGPSEEYLLSETTMGSRMVNQRQNRIIRFIGSIRLNVTNQMKVDKYLVAYFYLPQQKDLQYWSQDLVNTQPTRKKIKN